MTETSEPEPVGLSRGMRALWGIQEQGRRGPKPTTSAQQVGLTGVAIADEHGLGAVTMASVAGALGMTTMSLYRYVDSRQDLVEVMADVAFGPPPAPSRRRSWRGRLQDWAHANAAQLLAHPWVLSLEPGSPPVGPSLTSWMEGGFATLEHTGLPPQVRASALLAVDGFVRSSVALSLRFGDPEATRQWAPALRALLDPDRFPHVTAVLASGSLEDGTEEWDSEELDFGLGLMLDGIEAAITRLQA